MIGITLSSEQIRRAPPEVRQWIEEEVAATLGLKPPQQQPVGGRQGGQLAQLSNEEVAGVLSLIQGVLPAVNVLFELGRKGTAAVQEGVEAHRLVDVQHHTRLQSAEQVVACLDFINEALGRVRGSKDASFYGTSGDYIVVASETQQGIRRLWLELLARGQTASQAPAEAKSPLQEAAQAAAVPGAAQGLSPAVLSQLLQPAAAGG